MEFLNYSEKMFTLAMSGNVRGIFYLIALYTLMTLGYSFIYQVRVAAWPGTRGVLTKGRVEKIAATARVKTNQEYAVSALYQYTVDGKEYFGTRVSPWVMVASHNLKFLLHKQMSRIKQDNGDIVTVYFNPARPNKSYLIKPGKLSQSATAILAVAPMFLYWMKYHQ